MSLTPTVSVAGQAFPAVTTPQSFVEVPTPLSFLIADQPIARPSDVSSSPEPSYLEVNVSQQALIEPNRPEYLVLPNRRTNLPQNDPISPIVLEVTAWPAANRITVAQAIKGIIIPPLNSDLNPKGFTPTTQPIDLTSIIIALGRQILMVDNPTYLTPIPYERINDGALVTPQTTNFASVFESLNGATIIGISGTDTLILNRDFPASPVGYWLIIDQRLGFEVEANDFAFQGTFTPEPFLPYPTPTNAPFNGDSGTHSPQYAPPPAFTPNDPQSLPAIETSTFPSDMAQPFILNPPQALPPILQTVNPAEQAFDGLPDSYFP